MSRRLDQLDDSRLARRVAAGDAAAFEALYDRHHRSLLSFCRHMLGNAEDGEDALQQTFLRAHSALVAGQVPDAVRPWLFTIARNRCKTMLAARRAAAVPLDAVAEPSFDGLAAGIELRGELRELVRDLGRLPEDQRAALVLFELGGLSGAEIGTAIGVPPSKVKALVFQARTELMAERDARSTPCTSIQEELAVARGGALRRGPLRRHLKHCEPCQAYRAAIATQRAGLASILPVAPALGLKAAVLAAAAGKGTAAAIGGGAAGGAGAGGASSAGAGGSALAAKVAVSAVLLGGGALGGIAAVDRAAEPAGANASATFVAETPTPTASPTPTPTPTPTPDPGQKGSAEDSAPRAAPTPTPSATPSPSPTPTATASATAGPGGTAAAGKKQQKKRKGRARLEAVRGTVQEKAPTPAVTGEFSEPDPTATPVATATPRNGRRQGKRPRRTPAATPTPAATATPKKPPRPRNQPTPTPTP